MNRKKFLTSASVATLASFRVTSLLNEAVTGAKKPIPIIDTHQHIIDFERFGEDWSHPPVAGNFNEREYEKAIKGLNIIKAVYCEVAVPTDKRHEEALYAIELCKDKTNPTVAAVIKGDLYTSDFEEYMSEFKNSPYVKGIRGSFSSREGVLNDHVVKNVRVLGEMNLSLDISVQPAWLHSIPDLIRLCPDTKFILEHCGNLDPRAFLKPDALLGEPDHDRDQWIADMKAIASERNVACGISGVVTRSPGYPLTVDNLAPAIDQCLDIFGPDRVMFASDWPWCLKSMELRGWLDILKSVVANRSYQDQKKLFHDNALKFYNI